MPLPSQRRTQLAREATRENAFQTELAGVRPEPGGLSADAAAAVTASLTAHIADTANPHSVTAAQVGLGNVDNTSDVNKPVSTAQAAAIAAAVAGLSWKLAVRAATTAAGTLATSFENGDTVDGVVLATGDRILVKDQATAADNGIYTVNASGAPTRATDADTGAELVNASIYVSEGTVNADKQFVCTTNAPITPGTTALSFTQLSTGGGVSSGSSNPGAPATNDLFYRTDLKLLIVYDGTRWLTVGEYSLNTYFDGVFPATNTSDGIVRGTVPGDYAIYLTKGTITTFVNTTNDATKYWTIALASIDAANAVIATISNHSTQSDTASNWINENITFNAVVSTSATHLRFNPTKVSTPGTLRLYVQVFYRKIVT
jgi:hypothetical protein